MQNEIISNFSHRILTTSVSYCNRLEINYIILTITKKQIRPMKPNYSTLLLLAAASLFGTISSHAAPYKAEFEEDAIWYQQIELLNGTIGTGNACRTIAVSNSKYTQHRRRRILFGIQPASDGTIFRCRQALIRHSFLPQTTTGTSSYLPLLNSHGLRANLT